MLCIEFYCGAAKFIACDEFLFSLCAVAEATIKIAYVRDLKIRFFYHYGFLFEISVLLNEEKYSRLPVYDKTIDNIVGVLPVRKCLNAVLYRKNVAIWKLMSKPYFVALGTKLDDIVDGFSKNRTHMGIVVDKGKTIGIITMDDALEELIGDIVEETKEGDEAC